MKWSMITLYVTLSMSVSPHAIFSDKLANIDVEFMQMGDPNYLTNEMTLSHRLYETSKWIA